MQPKKEENFSDYAKTLYSNSLVTGIPEIVISHNWYLRIMRLVVFVCCIVGFIYQSLDFMDLYWKYPTILDIQITRKGEIMMPALTACDANGIRLSKYCQSYPCRKVEQEHRFCRCYPEGRYCNKRKLYPHVKIPLRMDDISQTVFLSQSERAHMMPQKESFIPSCVMKRPPSMVINCGNLTVSPACSNRVMEPTACFSINSLYMKPHEKPRNISVSTVIELALFSPPYEYDPDLMIMYKQLSLHSPYSLSNPFTEGLFLNSEKTYKVYVKQTVKNLLKPPYDTNCFDYLEAWKKNGGKGAMSESDCLQLCKMEIQLKKPGKCLSFNLWYPSNEYRCPTGKRWCEKEGRLLNSSECYNKPGIDLQSQFEDESCESQCKPGCWEIIYEILKEEVARVEPKKGQRPAKETGLTYVAVYFQKMEETLYTYKPKYEVVETFSYIGGYVGIWLGVSLLALFDFLETTMILLKYPFRKKKRFSQPKRA